MMTDRYSDKLKSFWYGIENNTNIPVHNFQYINIGKSWEVFQYTISAIYLKQQETTKWSPVWGEFKSRHYWLRL